MPRTNQTTSIDNGDEFDDMDAILQRGLDKDEDEGEDELVNFDDLDGMGMDGEDEKLTGKRRRVGKEEEEEEGDDMFYEEMVQRREKKKQDKADRKKYQELHVNDDYVGNVFGMRQGVYEQELQEGESRKATQKILKNRGLVASRPKENRNPRVKKRLRYEKAVKRRKGQVAAVRTNEADQYMGEKSGIRSDVVHARKFKQRVFQKACFHFIHVLVCSFITYRQYHGIFSRHLTCKGIIVHCQVQIVNVGDSPPTMINTIQISFS